MNPGAKFGTAEQLAAAMARASIPTAVLIVLQDWSRLHFGVDVLGMWHLPRYVSGSIGYWRDGENLWFHPDIPKDFFSKYKNQFEINGFSAMTLRARHSSVPFTFAEAERDARRSPGPRNWVFPFFRQHNMPDGLYCPKRQWAAVYVAPKILALSPGNRARLSGAAELAIGRVEALVKRRRRSSATTVELTPREREVLQLRAFHGNAEIAEKLGLSVDTVDGHLKAARKKLKVDDTAHALLEALRRGLIEY